MKEKKPISEIIRDYIQENELTEEHINFLEKLIKPHKQVTRRQHWVPQSYLEKFTAEDNLLQSFNIQEGKVIEKRYSPKSVCYGKFFYGAWTGKKDENSQFLERMFALSETDFSDLCSEFEKSIWSYGKIDDALRYAISFHIALLYLRTPYFRKKTIQWEKQRLNFYTRTISCDDELWSSLTKEFKKENPDITDKELDEVKKIFQNMETQKEVKINVSNIPHFHFLRNLKLVQNIFMIKTWKIYLLPENSNFRFITSDTPVLERPPRGWKFGNFHSPGLFDLVHYFPFSPRILIELSDPLEYGREIRKVKRKQITDDSFIQELNGHRLYDPQSEYVYSSRKLEFEDLKARRESDFSSF